MEKNKRWIVTKKKAKKGRTFALDHLKLEDVNATVDAFFSLYNVWTGISGRCCNNSQRGWNKYGFKGVTLCDEWKGRQGAIKFCKWALKNGWIRGLVVDRIDGALGYSPDNCRLVTFKDNARNKMNNRLGTYEGETKCIAAWGEDTRCKVSKLQFQQRIGLGWEIERALTTPLDNKGRKKNGKRKK